MMAAPAYCAAAWPVSTKMPAPMMAPMPSVMRLMGPSARLRPCSLVSEASAINISRGLVFSSLEAILEPSLGLRRGLARGGGTARPQEIYRNPQQDDDQ